MPHRLGLIARLEDGVALPLQRVPEHRAQRVLVLDDENLGGSGTRGPGRQRSQPGGTPAWRASSSMSAIGFFEPLDLALDAVQLGDRLLAILADLRALTAGLSWP